MDCTRTQHELGAYFDGELSATESVAFEQHLDACEQCRAVFEGNSLLRQSFADPSLYHRAPPELIEGIDALVPPPASTHRENRLPPQQRPWRIVGITAAAVAGMAACLVIAFVAFRSRAGGDDLVAQHIVASHVRSMMADHLLDVSSTDRHTVKPWFDGKLDFAPPVKDATAQGFPLIGGRLDYVVDRPVAALVYKRQQHVINLFVWTSGAAPDEPNRLLTRQGYNLVRWTRAGMSFWAVSDVELPQLQQFAQVIQAAE